MIPVYNTASFLKEAIASVLAQDPGEDIMQIEVVDDCSTDADIRQLVEETGKGRVLYYVQPQNSGSVRNFETCLNRAKGEIVHLLHSDDKVLPGFYEKMNELYNLFPEVSAACANYIYIDENNKFLFNNNTEATEKCVLHDFILRIGERCFVQYASMTVKRNVYEQTGGFYGVNYGEDWQMWGTIAKDFSIAYTPEVLAEYRIHSSNISSNSFRTGKNFVDITKVINKVNTFMPPGADKEMIRAHAFRNYARFALAFSEYIWHVSRDKKTVMIQVKGALKMHSDLYILRKALKVIAKIMLHPVRRLVGNVKH